ncbi:hypothetical protein CI610_02997 [invertebrate metagenome]|uniref:Uncharacterized protein n=1 Tax=invertebrate metagenome TaxID=1711999 RepID=A0A2H9T4F3_9ZZZZ
MVKAKTSSPSSITIKKLKELRQHYTTPSISTPCDALWPLPAHASVAEIKTEAGQYSLKELLEALLQACKKQFLEEVPDFSQAQVVIPAPTDQ